MKFQIRTNSGNEEGSLARHKCGNQPQPLCFPATLKVSLLKEWYMCVCVYVCACDIRVCGCVSVF